MPAYGNNPTSLGHLSDHELVSMYRGESWFSMDENARLELLQETVNRSAAANGEIGSCKVSFSKDMPHYTSGVQSGDEIILNYDHFVRDVTYVEHDGHTFVRMNDKSNMEALTTVLHEDIHAWQNQCIDETITCDEAVLREYAANNFDLSVIDKPDGTLAVGQQYLSGEGNNGYYMYYLQSTERDAHRFSEEKAMQAMDYLESKYGTEPSFQAFRQELAVNGYDAVMEQAKDAMKNEHAEQDLNTTLMNQFYGTHDTVHSEETAEAVKQEMVLSYEARLEEEKNNAVTAEETTEESAEEAVDSGLGESTEDGIGGGDDGGMDSGSDGGIDDDDGGIE